MRWWHERDELNLDETAAEFYLLSAARGRGYPMYWASVIEATRLREILDRELDDASAIPCQIYPYIVGVFLWDERREILEKHEDHLSFNPWRAIQEVIGADSYSEFLTSIRFPSRLWHSSELIAMRELLEDRQRGVEVFSELLHAELDGTITPNGSGFAKQLDMVVHAPI